MVTIAIVHTCGVYMVMKVPMVTTATMVAVVILTLILKLNGNNVHPVLME